jgi:hypothetical protein
VATRCPAAWSTGDFDTTGALLDDGVTFTGPLGATDGADAYIEGIKGMAKIVERVEQRDVFGEREDVCVNYDLITTQPKARVPTAGWYQVRAGRIASVRAFFDARPLRPRVDSK